MEEKRKTVLKWFDNHFNSMGLIIAQDGFTELNVFKNTSHELCYAVQFDNLGKDGFCIVHLYQALVLTPNIGFPIFCKDIFDLENLLNLLIE